MSFSTELKEELFNLKMWDNQSNLSQDEQITRLTLREEFIKSGFINNPAKDYHLEISCKTEKKAKEIIKMLEQFEIYAKITNKAKGKIIYLKDGEDISKFLALIGANNAVLRFEEARVEKSARNSINRIVNCETANLSKTVEAAKTQIENIKFLKRHKKFENLPDKLKEMLKSKIGKSGVYHRLNKINKIVEEIKVGK